MRSLKDICNVNIPNSLHSLLEGLLRGEEATLIDGDEIVKRPEIALNVVCNDIQQVADVVGKAVGKKIKLKKMTGKWYVDGYNSGPYIDVKGCEGFSIEHISKERFGEVPTRKLWFAVWEGRLVCKQEFYHYLRKPSSNGIITPEYTANPKNYIKRKAAIYIIGTGTKRCDIIYHWCEDSLWDWLEKTGLNRFFDKI